MSLALGSAKLGVGGLTSNVRPSRNYLVSTSIAEKAIFIPKPYKRVTFSMVAPDQALLGSGNKFKEPVALPGSGKTGISGSNITSGSLGTNGLTARFNRQAWQGAPGGYVKMEIDLTPSKQQDVIAIQEEGRQINHKEIHFTQQYDSYGRPRIGFSREPYDFAAAKFVSVTSQITFQENMQKTHDAYDEYNLYGQKTSEVEIAGPKPMGSGDKDQVEPQLFGSGKDEPQEIPIFGSTSSPESGSETSKVNEDFFLGANSNRDDDEPGEKDGDRVTAEESYKTQKVKIVDVFNVSDNSNGGGEAEEGGENVKGVDVTA